MQSGQTPIVIWWDYLRGFGGQAERPGLEGRDPDRWPLCLVLRPGDQRTAPDPAAARLWEEYLYSTTGQNLWLQGFARPIELPTLVKDGTVDKKAYQALPAAPKGELSFPTRRS